MKKYNCGLEFFNTQLSETVKKLAIPFNYFFLHHIPHKITKLKK